MKKTIPIFYAIDDEYSKFVAVSIKSLIMNANKDYNYDILKENDKLEFSFLLIQPKGLIINIIF